MVCAAALRLSPVYSFERRCGLGLLRMGFSVVGEWQ